jgi:chemotaxis protein methyltransferase CheR
VRFGEPRHVLSLERFRLLRDMINEKCGLYFSDDNRFLVQSRLSDRLSRLGLDSFDDYYHLLRYYPEAEAETAEIIEVLTTNETYFFREEYQLRSFTADVLPELAKRLARKRRLTVWSAGCSSGEEVYTLAMLLLDSELLKGWDIRVLGNDISARVLKKAQKGIFGPASFRAARPETVKRYFTETDEGMRINDEVRAVCHFGRANILSKKELLFIGRADAVFCRNVLIYLDKQSKLNAVSIFYNRLNPGGYLLLGHTESLINLSTAFELVHLSEDLVYRKPEAADD